MSRIELTPSDALEMHLEHREGSVAPSTLQSTEYRLNHFVRWCDVENIHSIQSIDRQDLHDYRVWRRQDGNLSTAAEKTQMDSLRVFVRHMETLSAVDEDLHTAVVSPRLRDNDKRRTDIVDSEAAEQILGRLRKYRYASVEHVVIELVWHTALRTGSLRALDVEDYNTSDQYLEVVNRPEQGTRLKNGNHGERFVALSETVCEVVDDYLDDQRNDVIDEYGREPLLVSSNSNRIAKNTIRNWAYRTTRPCWYGSDCPHDRDIDDCKAVNQTYAFKCPSSTATHSWRRGAITHMRRSEIPKPIVSDRADVSEPVLDEHYDSRTEKEQMEERRGFLDNI